jgi:putative lipoic acid-binding regulatory protein
LSGQNGNIRSEPQPTEPDDTSRIEAALDGVYDFPAFYPVVVIARQGFEFGAELHATVAAAQGDQPFRIRERKSSGGKYVSYRVEMHVPTARQALARKSLLAQLPGVLVLL